MTTAGRAITNDPSDVVDRLVDAMLTNDPEAAAAIYSEDVVIVDPLLIFFDTRDGYVTRDLSTWDSSELLKLREQSGTP